MGHCSCWQSLLCCIPPTLLSLCIPSFLCLIPQQFSDRNFACCAQQRTRNQSIADARPSRKKQARRRGASLVWSTHCVFGSRKTSELLIAPGSKATLLVGPPMHHSASSQSWRVLGHTECVRTFTSTCFNTETDSKDFGSASNVGAPRAAPAMKAPSLSSGCLALFVVCQWISPAARKMVRNVFSIALVSHELQSRCLVTQ